MSKLQKVSVSQLTADETQARQHYDEAELYRLGESLKERQVQPILIRADGKIIAGNRRFRAAVLVGLESLDAIIVEGELSPSEIRSIQLTENCLRADLTPHEKWQSCSELIEMNNWQSKDLAAHLHLDPSSVTRLLSPSKCIPQVQAALKEGKLGITDCYAISKQAEEKQAGLLALKLSGASRDDLERAGRKGRSQNKDAVKVSRIKCNLPSGYTLSVSGVAMTMHELIDALTEAMKEARKARDDGLDVKTFQSVLRDKSKVGAL